jgi:uncharacterized protein DUF6233
MSDLPPDVPRLRVIETFLRERLVKNDVIATYLRLQLDAVQRRIAEIETAEPSAAWRLQHLPRGVGQPGTGVLHRDDCFIDGGGKLDREAAVMALDEDNIEMCEACQPERELRTEQSG